MKQNKIISSNIQLLFSSKSKQTEKLSFLDKKLTKFGYRSNGMQKEYNKKPIYRTHSHCSKTVTVSIYKTSMLMDQKVGYHLENFYAPVPNMMHYIRGASSRALYGCIQPKSLYICRAVEFFSWIRIWDLGQAFFDMGTTLPNNKQMDLLKKVINMNLLFSNNNFRLL